MSEGKDINMYPPINFGENYMEQRNIINNPYGVHFSEVCQLLPEMQEQSQIMIEAYGYKANFPA